MFYSKDNKVYAAPTGENHVTFHDSEFINNSNDIHVSQRVSLKRNKSFRDVPKSTKSSTAQNLSKKFWKQLRKLAVSCLHTDAFDKDKIIMRTLLREQTLYYENNKSLFSYIVQNDLAGLKTRLQAEEENTGDFNADKKLIEQDIDPTGANIIHAAYLFRNYEIGRWLVENYPDQAFLPYERVCDDSFDRYGLQINPEEMPYTGQNILHIAIVHKNLGEIRWLLEFYSKHKHSCPQGLEILLNTGTKGTFFAPDTSEFYCGCYPIHFAAGSNSPELFDLVLAYFTSSSTSNKTLPSKFSSDKEGVDNPPCIKTESNNDFKIQFDDTKASSFRRRFKTKQSRIKSLGNNAIFMRDQYGNNCLHICVIYRLDNMYDHIKKVAKSLLRNEIKQAYGQYLRSNKKENSIKLKPLPSWNVFSTTYENIDSMKTESRNTVDSSCSTDETDSDRTKENPYTITKTLLKLLHREDNDKTSVWYTLKHTTAWKKFSKVLISLLHRYIPFYSNFSASRIKRVLMGREVIEKDLDNGFYFGYSLSETPIYPPGDGERVSKAVFLEWLDQVVQTKVEERFEWVLNEQFHSPLTLTSAGTSGDVSVKGTDEQEEKEKNTIQFIINQIKQFRWEYGPVKSFLLYLEGIELPYDVRRFGQSPSSKPLPPYAEFEMFGVVEWICITNSDRSVLIPEVKSLIEAKWVNMGLPLFARDFILWNIITILITILVLYDNNLPEPNPDSFSQWLVTIIYPLNLFFILILAATELPGILYYGLEYWGILGKRIRGAAKLNKLLTTVTIALYITLCFFKWYQYKDFLYTDSQNNLPVQDTLSNSSYIPTASPITVITRELVARVGGTGESSSNSTLGDENPLSVGEWYLPVKKIEVILVLVAWIKMYYYFMGFDQTGPFVLSIANIVGGDVPFFLMFFVIILVAFSAALCVITMGYDTSSNYGFYIFIGGVFDLIQITVSIQLPPTSNFDPSNVPQDMKVIYDFVITLFYVIVVLMFINILIAMISNTYQIYTDKNDSLLLLEKYNIMCGLDMSMFWLRTREDAVEAYATQINKDIENKRKIQSNKKYIKNLFDKRKNIGNSIDASDDRTITVISSRTSSLDAKSATENVKSIPIYAFELQTNSEEWWLESELIKLNNDDTTTITLLIMDPQNDFHEGYGNEKDADYRPKGSLAVPGSLEDSKRIHDLIVNNIDKIDKIIVTMDSHHPNHIAHAICWKKGPFHQDILAANKKGQKSAFSSTLSTPSNTSFTIKTPSAANNTNGSNIKGNFSFGDVSKSRTVTCPTFSISQTPKVPPPKSVKLAPINSPLHPHSDHSEDKHGPIYYNNLETKPTSKQLPAIKTFTTESKSSEPSDVAQSKESETDLIGVLSVDLEKKGQNHVEHEYKQHKQGNDDATRNEAKIQHPLPFTVISYSDIEKGVWQPVNKDDLEWCLYYTKELEKLGKMKLTIWPNHCIIGTQGHAVEPLINEALQKWAMKKSESIEYIMKGQNLRTEMYSALSADVEDPEDPNTAFNEQLMSKLRISDKVLICGQARSHVVKYTVLDILKYWHDDKTRLCLLEDGCSSVLGYEKQGNQFLDDMKKKGLTVCKCDEVFKESIDTNVTNLNTHNKKDVSNLEESSILENF